MLSGEYLDYPSSCPDASLEFFCDSYRRENSQKTPGVSNKSSIKPWSGYPFPFCYFYNEAQGCYKKQCSLRHECRYCQVGDHKSKECLKTLWKGARISVTKDTKSDTWYCNNHASGSRVRYDPAFIPFVAEYTNDNLADLINGCISSEEPYYLRGVRSQLKPKAWLKLLTSGSGIDPDLHYILVVDHAATPNAYSCKIYSSCFNETNYGKLKEIIRSECNSGKLSRVDCRPRCIHPLGVIKKRYKQSQTNNGLFTTGRIC